MSNPAITQAQSQKLIGLPENIIVEIIKGQLEARPRHLRPNMPLLPRLLGRD
ncbi:MAG: hypothetical protein ACXWTW_00800 [Methylobacter sp.]